jgi:hypothetical protein
MDMVSLHKVKKDISSPPHVNKGISMSTTLQNTTETDLEKAQRMCKEIRDKANNDAILDIYYDYQTYFLTFAQKRLYQKSLADKVVTDYWVELTNGNAICAFEAKNNATLKTYLTKALNWRIITANKKIVKNRQRQYSGSDTSGEESEMQELNGDSEPSYYRRPITKGSTQYQGHEENKAHDVFDDEYFLSPNKYFNEEEDELIEEIHRDFYARYVFDGLAELRETQPRCAKLIELNAKGSYTKEQLSKIILDNDNPSEDMLRKEINEKGTGRCQLKLQVIIERMLAAKK